VVIFYQIFNIVLFLVLTLAMFLSAKTREDIPKWGILAGASLASISIYLITTGITAIVCLGLTLCGIL